MMRRWAWCWAWVVVAGWVGMVEAGEVAFDEIVFVKRMNYSSDHYYTDIDNGTSSDRFRPDNGIFVFNLRTRSERPVVTGADLPGGKALIGKISLSFDARKILFDARIEPDSGFRVWEVNVDGTGLRQVSFPPEDEAEKAARWGNPDWHTDDIHPCYLPDGRIIFSSTRNEHTVLCGGSGHLAAPGLHRMDPDGTNIEPLTRSPVSEFAPSVMDDGRVLYHRWEYIDKGARVSKTLWAMNPDGTRPQGIYGVADDTTTVYMYPQAVPGSDQQFVCVGTCHYPQGGCVGAIMLIDIRRGGHVRGPDPNQSEFVPLDDRYAVINITPHVFVERRTEPGWHFLTSTGDYVHDTTGRQGHLYTHPFPINEHQFLVAYKADPSDHYQQVANAYALYLIDVDGNHEFVHADPELSCWHPIPLVARPVPPHAEAARDPSLAARNQAVCVVNDVCRGMEGVEPGEVKWLRINEALPRYWSTGRRWDPSLSSSGWRAALWPRVQWGVVPVEEDGSAHFLVPADRAIFLQALDADFQELQRERTYVNYRPGEMRLVQRLPRPGGSRGPVRWLARAPGAKAAPQRPAAAAVRPGRERRRRAGRASDPLPHRYPAALRRALRRLPRRDRAGGRIATDRRSDALLQRLVRGTRATPAGRADHRRVHVVSGRRPGQL